MSPKRSYFAWSITSYNWFKVWEWLSLSNETCSTSIDSEESLLIRTDDNYAQLHPQDYSPHAASKTKEQPLSDDCLNLDMNLQPSRRALKRPNIDSLTNGTAREIASNDTKAEESHIMPISRQVFQASQSHSAGTEMLAESRAESLNATNKPTRKSIVSMASISGAALGEAKRVLHVANTQNQSYIDSPNVSFRRHVKASVTKVRNLPKCSYPRVRLLIRKIVIY